MCGMETSTPGAVGPPRELRGEPAEGPGGGQLGQPQGKGRDPRRHIAAWGREQDEVETVMGDTEVAFLSAPKWHLCCWPSRSHLE